jgi:hypothetical protein
LVIDKSGAMVTVLVSVAELFPAVGSVTVAGGVTVAVFASVPVAVDDNVAVNVYVAVPLTGRVTVSLIEPVPDATHVAPADATQVHDAPLSEAGNVSATAIPVTAEGPLFEATMV